MWPFLAWIFLENQKKKIICEEKESPEPSVCDSVYKFIWSDFQAALAVKLCNTCFAQQVASIF